MAYGSPSRCETMCSFPHPLWHVSWCCHSAGLVWATVLWRSYVHSFSCHVWKTLSSSRCPGPLVLPVPLLDFSLTFRLCCRCCLLGLDTIQLLIFKFSCAEILIGIRTDSYIAHCWLENTLYCGKRELIVIQDLVLEDSSKLSLHWRPFSSNFNLGFLLRTMETKSAFISYNSMLSVEWLKATWNRKLRDFKMTLHVEEVGTKGSFLLSEIELIESSDNTLF